MANAQTFQNCTLYMKNEFMGNIVRCDANMVVIEDGMKYAQYTNATRVDYIPKGKRKSRGRMVTSYPFIVVVRREDAIDPASMYGEATITDGGVEVREGRYSGFDDRWVTDFQALMAEKGIKPLYEKISLERNY